MPNETFRQEKLTDYTVIRNAIFKDYTLSAKAVGVACKLLSLPPTWEYSVRGLVTLFSDGEASIRNALTELEEAGYLRREQVRTDGKFSKCVYVISDELVLEKPCVENPHAVNPLAENPPQLNTNKSNTNKSNTKQYRFKPPTIDEVRAYIAEKGFSVDAGRFIDYYTANGWKVGGRASMKDWKAAVRNWERNNGTNVRTSDRERQRIRETNGAGNQGTGAGRTKLPPSAPMSYEDSRSEDDA